jgi:microcystin-dependent protein
MSDYFVGELRVFAFNRIPKGWLPCDGRLVNITGNQALFALLGNGFGGDGKTTFALPDLRGRVTMGTNNLTQRATQSGAEGVVLTAAQVPPHTHTIQGVSGGTIVPVAPLTNNYMSEAKQLPSPTAAQPFNIYGPPPTNPPQPGNAWAPLDSTTFSSVGANEAHENRQPVLPLQICIATSGLFPTRN